MTEITKTEISTEDVVTLLVNGTSKRRLMVFIRGSATADALTLNLATYIASIADVEGILYETYADVKSVTASTWSTSTITFQSDAASTRAYEGAFMCTLT